MSAIRKLIEDIREIRSIRVDWDIECADVETSQRRWHRRTGRRNSVVGSSPVAVARVRFSAAQSTNSTMYSWRRRALRQSDIYELIRNVSAGLMRSISVSGAVHGCALCTHTTESLIHVEDVGRHNAADAISGFMWLDDIQW